MHIASLSILRPVLQAGDEERREPDDEVLAELVLLLAGQAHGAAADVQAAERARPPAARQPAVDAVPVEGVAARQAPDLLPVAARRYAHAAVPRRAVVPAAVSPALAVGRHLRPDLHAAAGQGRGEQRHHLAHRHGQHRLYCCASAPAPARSFNLLLASIGWLACSAASDH